MTQKQKFIHAVNSVYDWLYEVWTGYPRCKVCDPLIKSSLPGTIPIAIKNQAPEYLNLGPLKANSTVINNHELSEMFTRSCQVEHIIDLESYNTDFPVTGKVWVYNVSKVSQKVDHPSLGAVEIPGNTSRKRYVMWTSFPNVVKMPAQAWGPNGEILASYRLMDGKRFAMDLINPDNLGLDQNSKPPSTSIGRHLGVRGVFWSVNNPPKKAEVDAAILRLETFYQDLMQRAHIIYRDTRISAESITKSMEKNKCSMEVAINGLKGEATRFEITPEHHAAAEWFRMTTDWHPVLEVK